MAQIKKLYKKEKQIIALKKLYDYYKALENGEAIPSHLRSVSSMCPLCFLMPLLGDHSPDCDGCIWTHITNVPCNRNKKLIAKFLQAVVADKSNNPILDVSLLRRCEITDEQQLSEWRQMRISQIPNWIKYIENLEENSD